MKYLFGVLALGLVLLSASCSDSGSKNEFAKYFYEYDSIPKVYVYRDISHGLSEEYHRIVGLEDSEGKHIVVEIYSEDGRIIEAYNYNLDSLNVIDHMVVDRKFFKQKALLSERHQFPMEKKDTGVFASNFPGIMDSTFFLKFVERTYEKEMPVTVLGKKLNGVRFKDDISLKLYNPWKNLEDTKSGEAFYYYAEGYGLVEWHSANKENHYQLEKILSESQFINIMNK